MDEHMQSEGITTVTFELDDETYALEIRKVQEVLEYTTVTKVPQTPPCMPGVINLRGKVVPVVDLRLRFGMSETVKTQGTRILILEVTMEGETTLLGAIADSVREVIELPPEQIGPAPKIGMNVASSFIKAIARREEEFIILLDIDRVFTSLELAQMEQAHHEAPPAGEPSELINIG